MMSRTSTMLRDVSTAAEPIERPSRKGRSAIDLFRSLWSRPTPVGLAVSCLLHGFVCLVLAFWVWKHAALNDYTEVLQSLQQVVGDREVRFESAATDFGDPGGEAPPLINAPIASRASLLLGNLIEPEIPLADFVESAPDGEANGRGRGGKGHGTGGGIGDGSHKAVGKKAVMEGSFTVWTIPEDPTPGENYKIMIEVKLPEKVSRYPRSDLMGLVTGTDGWRQPLPGNALPLVQYLPIEENSVQLEVDVPGAGRLVKDTVKVRSKLLKEEQVLTIVF